MTTPATGADPVDRALTKALALLLDAVATLPPDAVVLIDGCSGAGKSTLARSLAAAWPAAPPAQLIALDSLYPGWDGMDAGVEDARRSILEPHAAGRTGTWREWDWAHDEYAAQRAVDPHRPLIVEGSGLLTAATAPLADVRVWLESPEASRRPRALARDGETYRPHWERWARQEARHVLRDAPRRLATLVVDVP